MGGHCEPSTERCATGRPRTPTQRGAGWPSRPASRLTTLCSTRSSPTSRGGGTSLHGALPVTGYPDRGGGGSTSTTWPVRSIRSSASVGRRAPSSSASRLAVTSRRFISTYSPDASPPSSPSARPPLQRRYYKGWHLAVLRHMEGLCRLWGTEGFLRAQIAGNCSTTEHGRASMIRQIERYSKRVSKAACAPITDGLHRRLPVIRASSYSPCGMRK